MVDLTITHLRLSSLKKGVALVLAMILTRLRTSKSLINFNAPQPEACATGCNRRPDYPASWKTLDKHDFKAVGSQVDNLQTLIDLGDQGQGLFGVES